MRYVFHPEALTEYAEAVKYYSEQRIEIAQAFINAIEDAVLRQPPTEKQQEVLDFAEFLRQKVSPPPAPTTKPSLQQLARLPLAQRH